MALGRSRVQGLKAMQAFSNTLGSRFGGPRSNDCSLSSCKGFGQLHCVRVYLSTVGLCLGKVYRCRYVYMHRYRYVHLYI